MVPRNISVALITKHNRLYYFVFITAIAVNEVTSGIYIAAVISAIIAAIVVVGGILFYYGNVKRQLQEIDLEAGWKEEMELVVIHQVRYISIRIILIRTRICSRVVEQDIMGADKNPFLSKIIWGDTNQAGQFCGVYLMPFCRILLFDDFHCILFV